MNLFKQYWIAIVCLLLFTFMPLVYVFGFNIGYKEFSEEHSIVIDSYEGAENWGRENSTTAYYFFGHYTNNSEETILVYVPRIYIADLETIPLNEELLVLGNEITPKTYFTKEVPYLEYKWFSLKEIKGNEVWSYKKNALIQTYFTSFVAPFMPFFYITGLIFGSDFTGHPAAILITLVGLGLWVGFVYVLIKKRHWPIIITYVLAWLTLLQFLMIFMY